MTTVETFRDSLGDTQPPAGLSPPLQGLWWAAKGDWDQAHAIAQQAEGEPAHDRLHAYLHRLEGDGGNARYWYRRAGLPVSTVSLEAEWAVMARDLLNSVQT